MGAELRAINGCKGSIEKLLLDERERDGYLNEIKQIRLELENLHNEIKILRLELTKADFSEELYLKTRSMHDTCQELYNLARVQKVKTEGEVDKLNGFLTRSKKELSEYDEKNLILEEAKKDFIILEKSDQLLTDLRKYLNAQLRPRLAQLASEYLAELSDGRYNTVEIAQDFTPQVIEDGEIKTVISGGEEDLLNLCLRLALSNMLAERSAMTFSTLILDEVFGALDDNRRNNVLILLEKLSRRFEQILVITHLEDIREGVHNLISINYNESSAELEIFDKLDFESQDYAENI